MIKLIKKHRLALRIGLVIIVSFLFRFWRLTEFPASLNIDEVIIGYDSYSLLKTGRDHWGKFLPLAFQSTGDYKPPILIYLMIPAIKIFGLNEFGIRFTIALIGSLTPLIVYGLVNKLFKNRSMATIAALLLAISPWHIQFSRSTFEAILALFLVILGMFLFLKSLEEKGRGLWLAGLCLSLSMYAYHAERVFVPVLLVAVAIIFWQEIWRHKKESLIALAVNFLVLIPFLFIILSPQGQTRARDSIFTNDYELTTVRLAEMEQWSGRSQWERILNGELVNTFSFWAKRYLEYSDPRYLFFKGMSYTHDKFPDVGIMYCFELVFFFGGIFYLMGNYLKINKKYKRLIFAWLLLGPIAASLANNSQHPLRSLTTIPIPQLISAVGIYGFFIAINKSKLKTVFKKGIFVLLGGMILVNVGYYLDIYYVHNPVHYSHHIMYGMKEIALYAWENRDKYDQIIIDRKFGIEDKNIVGIPFAYVLTYGKVDPLVIQRARQGNKTPLSFENFAFREIYWPKDRKLKKTLLVASFWQLSPDTIPEEQVVKIVSLYDGRPMFYLVETDVQ